MAITAAIWSLIALDAATDGGGAYWLIPIVAGMILSFVTALHVHRDFDRALVVRSGLRAVFGPVRACAARAARRAASRRHPIAADRIGT